MCTALNWVGIAVVLGVLMAHISVCPAADNYQIRITLRSGTRTINLSGEESEPASNGAAGALSNDSARPESGRPVGFEISDSDDLVSEAVVKALDFFARKQKPQGYWAETQSPIAHTGLVVLSFLGYGVTHKSVLREGTEPYMNNVGRALDWLIDQVGPNGELNDGGRRYDQAMGVYALAEAYMATKDERLWEPLKKTAKLLESSQLSDGGWRYSGSYSKGDLSVTGWVVSALVSARNAGVDLPDKIFERAGAFVFARHKRDGKYGYKDGQLPKLTMTAVGLFSLQLLGQEIMGPIVSGSGFNWRGGGGRKNNSAVYKGLIEKSTETLRENPPNVGVLKLSRPYYYWYYGTFAMRIIGGKSWAEWKDEMHNTLLATQLKNGTVDDGSWNPKQKDTGRIVTTAWVVLTMMAPKKGGLKPRRPRGLLPGHRPPR